MWLLSSPNTDPVGNGRNLGVAAIYAWSEERGAYKINDRLKMKVGCTNGNFLRSRLTTMI